MAFTSKPCLAASCSRMRRTSSTIGSLVTTLFCHEFLSGCGCGVGVPESITFGSLAPAARRLRHVCGWHNWCLSLLSRSYPELPVPELPVRFPPDFPRFPRSSGETLATLQHIDAKCFTPKGWVAVPELPRISRPPFRSVETTSAVRGQSLLSRVECDGNDCGAHARRILKPEFGPAGRPSAVSVPIC